MIQNNVLLSHEHSEEGRGVIDRRKPGRKTACAVVQAQRAVFQDRSVKGPRRFCREDIKAGEVIEVAPLFILNEADSSYIPRMLLWDYVFSLKDERISPGLLERLQIQDQSKANCIAMGISSFCNHLVDPNAGMEWIEDDHSAFIVLKAKKEIPAGIEICINYGIAWLTLHKKM